MSTGLTFGSIASLFGFNYGYINQAQYSILVTVVIGSAVIPTIIAQVFFQPRKVGPMGETELEYEGTAEHFLHSAEE